MEDDVEDEDDDEGISFLLALIGFLALETVDGVGEFVLPLSAAGCDDARC